MTPIEGNLPSWLLQQLEGHLRENRGKSNFDSKRIQKFIQDNKLFGAKYSPIYRVLSIKFAGLYQLFQNKYTKLEKRKYESWTKSTKALRNFIDDEDNLQTRNFKPIIVLKRKLQLNEIIIDIDYLYQKGYFTKFPKIFVKEREIITEQFCHQCPIKNIKYIIIPKVDFKSDLLWPIDSQKLQKHGLADKVATTYQLNHLTQTLRQL